MTTVEPRSSNESRLAQLAASGCFSRAVAVAARLGLADLAADTPRSPAYLAEHTGTDTGTLTLLLRTLALQGVFTETESGAFLLGDGFGQLRAGHPYSLRNFVILTAETYDDAFGALLHTVRSGKSGFREVFGTSFYDHLAENPDTERVFDEAMAELARPVADALVTVHDFSQVRTVVDVGGGAGALLSALLGVHPHLSGVCVDRPSVCDRARDTPRDPRLAGRLSFHASDIFREVPPGGDRYLIKNVLHDWSFESCLALLGAVRTAMTGTDARLLIVEPFFEAATDAPHALFQMVVCEDGTRGLAEADFHRLLTAARFTVRSVTRMSGGHNVFECAL
ncbi:hypothetical protein JOF53_006760 [Crossiella equi]|uniref:Methyltransferase n=1 Tax=Crossiella equi TaxID=130796 RepID=A0ABS5AMV4_9PSEU|nr:methyltransferase [Crossiella equi]MBP2477888.1 hypothetical protein [Crossiella equi]